MSSETFIDWITVSQLHPEGGLPILSGGVTVQYDPSGLPIFERNKSQCVLGSYDTAVRVGCDGLRVSLSGNPGRFSRQDNVFSFGVRETISRCNRILSLFDLPSLESTTQLRARAASGVAVPESTRGAYISRLDITRNYSTGTESAARAFIRWLGGQSIARMKKGRAGDESVWWSNTRHMLKAYIKHIEMLKHGSSDQDSLVTWLRDKGVVRIEVELKKRILSELELNDLSNVTDEKLSRLFDEQTAMFGNAEQSFDEVILESLPRKSRVYAAAWLAGQDMRDMASRATLFRHAKLLRDSGIDILSERDVKQFPTKVRVIELTPLEVPDWYVYDKISNA